MEKPTLQQLTEVIRQEWDKDTSSRPDEWTPDNPARGQSIATSLVVQDLLGGSIEPLFVYGDKLNEVEICYRNKLPDGQLIELTAEEYVPLQPVQKMDAPINFDMLMEANYLSVRDSLMAISDNEKRRKALMTRVMIMGGI